MSLLFRVWHRSVSSAIVRDDDRCVLRKLCAFRICRAIVPTVTPSPPANEDDKVMSLALRVAPPCKWGPGGHLHGGGEGAA